MLAGTVKQSALPFFGLLTAQKGLNTRSTNSATIEPSISPKNAVNTLLICWLWRSRRQIHACERADLIQGVVKLIHRLPAGAFVKTINEELRLKLNFATPTKKRPERYETVRAFGSSVYVASLSSVSRYLVCGGYPTLVTTLSIAIESLFFQAMAHPVTDCSLNIPIGSPEELHLRSCTLTEEAPGSYIMAMKAVGLKVLKNKLSEYVRLAEHGETVLVTDRDRVVAELVPPERTRSPVLADALLSEAVRKGWITPPALAGSEPPPRNPITSFGKLLKELEQDRSDR